MVIWFIVGAASLLGGGYLFTKSKDTIQVAGDETEDVIQALIPLIILIIIGYIIFKKV